MPTRSPARSPSLEGQHPVDVPAVRVAGQVEAHAGCPLICPVGSAAVRSRVSRSQQRLTTRSPNGGSSSAFTWAGRRGTAWPRRRPASGRRPSGGADHSPSPNSSRRMATKTQARPRTSRPGSLAAMSDLDPVTRRSQKMPTMSSTDADHEHERAEGGRVERLEIVRPRDQQLDDEDDGEQARSPGRRAGPRRRAPAPGGGAARARAGWPRPCRAPRRGCRRPRAGCGSPSRPSRSPGSASGRRRCPARPRAGRRGGSRPARG